MDVLNHFGWDKDVTVIGYSMGGSIAVHLNGEQPDLIANLILLAPAGMIRPGRFGFDKFSYFRSGFLSLEDREERLKERILGDIKKFQEARRAEITNPQDSEGAILRTAVIESREWFINNHKGFLHAVAESTSEAPLFSRVGGLGTVAKFLSGTDQSEAWKKLRSRKPGTTTIILGRGDDKINHKEFRADVIEKRNGGLCLEDNIRLEILPKGADGKEADHHLPMTRAPDVLEIIESALGMK
ncbi:uncharacterized protein DNG_08917 [Cephalotrichum gorgonifer]|uniref:AB hydrolase-1 domain-containing protein n=1 Tax=Cephalotrichum gorgonifer TaxID=2041049 RepID=A0AAE8N6I4_9PEZI|nr:uncharacterized protein DNG_08917 [Cephalotrichum gorgonifer]